MLTSVCVALALSFAFASLAHAQQSLPNSGTCRELTSALPQQTIPSNSAAPHYYFYVRAVNVLGQEGQKTDIISKTSDAFGPHISDQWGSLPPAY